MFLSTQQIYTNIRHKTRLHYSQSLFTSALTKRQKKGCQQTSQNDNCVNKDDRRRVKSFAEVQFLPIIMNKFVHCSNNI